MTLHQTNVNQTEGIPWYQMPGGLDRPHEETLDEDEEIPDEDENTPITPDFICPREGCESTSFYWNQREYAYRNMTLYMNDNTGEIQLEGGDAEGWERETDSPDSFYCSDCGYEVYGRNELFDSLLNFYYELT